MANFAVSVYCILYTAFLFFCYRASKCRSLLRNLGVSALIRPVFAKQAKAFCTVQTYFLIGHCKDNEGTPAELTGVCNHALGA